MKKINLLIIATLFFANGIISQTTKDVKSFHKVIVSPHIAVTFVQGSSEEVQIESCSEDMKKLNIEVNAGTLRIYLEGAKEYTKNEKYYENGHKRKKSIYEGTIAIVKVVYQNIDELSLRGEEEFICESPITGEDFRLKIFGASEVTLTEVDLESFHATTYGGSSLKILKGSITDQKYKGYGESKIEALNIETNTAKITAFGEGDYQLKVSERIRVTSYGEAKVSYLGDARLEKGIVIGHARIERINE